MLLKSILSNGGGDALHIFTFKGTCWAECEFVKNVPLARLHGSGQGWDEAEYRRR